MLEMSQALCLHMQNNPRLCAYIHTYIHIYILYIFRTNHSFGTEIGVRQVPCAIEGSSKGSATLVICRGDLPANQRWQAS